MTIKTCQSTNSIIVIMLQKDTTRPTTSPDRHYATNYVSPKSENGSSPQSSQFQLGLAPTTQNSGGITDKAHRLHARTDRKLSRVAVRTRSVKTDPGEEWRIGSTPEA